MLIKDNKIPNKIQTLHPPSELTELFHAWMSAFKKMEFAEGDGNRDYGSGDQLNFSDIHAIVAVGHNPDMNITDLAEFMGLSKSSISQIISKLSEKSLVRKFRSEGNNKEIRLCLTPRGKIAFLGHEQFHAKLEEHLQQHLGKISDDEIKNLITICNALEKTADWIIQNRNRSESTS